MRPADKNAFLSLAGCVLLMVGLFSKHLGIPEAWSVVPMFAGLACIYISFRRQKGMKPEDINPPHPGTVKARKMTFFCVTISLVLGCIGVLPFLPYMVDNFNSGLYYVVIPCQIVGLVIALPLLWKKIIGPANSAA